MTAWEYVIVALPSFGRSIYPGQSAAADALNEEGRAGWEAVGMTVVNDGVVAVLLKRPVDG